jgi:hypothetical protein
MCWTKLGINIIYTPCLYKKENERKETQKMAKYNFSISINLV